MTDTPEAAMANYNAVVHAYHNRVTPYDPIGASMPVRQIKVPLVEFLVVSLVIGCVPFAIGLMIAWVWGL